MTGDSIAVLLWTASFLASWAPGSLVRRLLGIDERDFATRLALDLALGLCLWPLLLLWSTLAGLIWTRTGILVVLALCLAGSLTLQISTRTKGKLRRPSSVRERWIAGSFAALVLLSVASRVHQAWELAFPPWVDSVHHTMILRLLVEHGSIPTTYDPLIESAPFFFHWGFHATPSAIAHLTGLSAPLDLPVVLLHFGQFVSSLTIIMLYPAGVLLLRSRAAGMLAASIATFISWFPAYYISWGRYTHLTGALLLPVFLYAVWKTGRDPRRWSVVLTILAAGLALIHIRMAFFAGIVAIVLAILLWTSHRRWQTRRALAVCWILAALAGTLLVLPWVWRLSNSPVVRHLADGRNDLQDSSRHRDIPDDSLVIQRNLISFATAGVTGAAGHLDMPRRERAISLLWFVLVVASMTRAVRGGVLRVLALLGASVALPASVLLIRTGALDVSRVVSYGSGVISLFLPLSYAAASLASVTMSRILRLRWRSTGIAICAVLFAVVGLAWQLPTVNQRTILATAADRRALVWIEDNVEGGVFAVDSAPWLGAARRGVDGGYWIGVATSQRSILPPSFYGWVLTEEDVTLINRQLIEWSTRRDDTLALRQLHAGGVTHLYVGERGDQSRAGMLARTRGVRVLYASGGSWVFELSRE